MRKIIAGVVLVVCTSAVLAQQSVKVSYAWTRATVAGQLAAGVFMEMTSLRDAILLKAETPLGIMELHEMKMQGDVMKMRPINSILLPANKTVVLQPGGLHIMLMGVEKPLKAGDKLPLKLTFEFADKHKEVVSVEADVAAQASISR